MSEAEGSVQGGGSPGEGVRFSLVVPVYNEGRNIRALCAAARRQLPEPYEMLICYDFEEDDTLAALAELGPEEKPRCVRLIRNELGPGVRWAIEAGMRAAAGPVVVVTMADLSDDLGAVPAMVERALAGAAVVSGSRYMKGGRQIGGPWIKRLLSWLAGWSLYWLAGLPTHDPTNSFRAYRKDFLERVRLESRAGFALALELTVKAHFAGLRVEEVPVTWRERKEGKSRFRLWRWLPEYLRWYVWALRRRWLG